MAKLKRYVSIVVFWGVIGIALIWLKSVIWPSHAMGCVTRQDGVHGFSYRNSCDEMVYARVCQMSVVEGLWGAITNQKKLRCTTASYNPGEEFVFVYRPTSGLLGGETNFLQDAITTQDFSIMACFMSKSPVDKGGGRFTCED